MYGDSYGQENEEAYRSLSTQYDELGKKMQILCIIIIATIVMAVLAFFGGIIAAATDYLSGSNSIGVFAIVVGIISFGIAIAYGITIIGMGTYDEELKTAGILYICSSVCSNINDLFFDETWIGFILKLTAAILSVIYILKFATSMENLSFNADSGVSDTWAKFRKAYIIVIVGTIVCVFCMIIPIINILAALAAIVFLIATIVIYIWQIVLMFKTAAVMKGYNSGNSKMSKFFE